MQNDMILMNMADVYEIKQYYVYVEIIPSNITKIKAIELIGGIKSYG